MSTPPRRLLACVFLVVALAAQAARAQDALAPGAHRLDADGTSLWYRVAGRPDGEPVVVLHGGPGEGSQSFAAFAGPALERRVRIVYLDQRGSGRSERPKDPARYSIALLVDDIGRLRLALCVERVALVGHSFGTILALEYAAKYPSRVSHVVLAAAVSDLPALQEALCRRLATDDPAAYRRAAHGHAAGDVPRCDPFAAYAGRAQRDYVARNMYPRAETRRRVDAMDAADGLGNTGELGGALVAQGFDRYRFAQAAAVEAPVLVIAGERDLQAAVGPQRALARALPRGRIAVWRGHGHFMFVEDPERFAREVGAFLATP